MEKVIKQLLCLQHGRSYKSYPAHFFNRFNQAISFRFLFCGSRIQCFIFRMEKAHRKELFANG